MMQQVHNTHLFPRVYMTRLAMRSISLTHAVSALLMLCQAHDGTMNSFTMLVERLLDCKQADKAVTVVGTLLEVTAEAQLRGSGVAARALAAAKQCISLPAFPEEHMGPVRQVRVIVALQAALCSSFCCVHAAALLIRPLLCSNHCSVVITGSCCTPAAEGPASFAISLQLCTRCKVQKGAVLHSRCRRRNAYTIIYAL